MKSPTRSGKPLPRAMRVSMGRDRAGYSPRASMAYSALLTLDSLKLKLREAFAWIAGRWGTGGTASLRVSMRNESERG